VVGELEIRIRERAIIFKREGETQSVSQLLAGERRGSEAITVCRKSHGVGKKKKDSGSVAAEERSERGLLIERGWIGGGRQKDSKPETQG